MASFPANFPHRPFRPPREELTQAEPFAVALGNLTPTNPRATARGRTTDDRTDGWMYGFGRSDGRTDGGGGLGWRLARIGRTDGGGGLGWRLARIGRTATAVSAGASHRTVGRTDGGGGLGWNP